MVQEDIPHLPQPSPPRNLNTHTLARRVLSVVSHFLESVGGAPAACPGCVRRSQDGTEELLLPEGVLWGGHGRKERVLFSVGLTVRHQVSCCLRHLMHTHTHKQCTYTHTHARILCIHKYTEHAYTYTEGKKGFLFKNIIQDTFAF